MERRGCRRRGRAIRLATQADRDGLDLFTDTPADEALARWATEIVPAVREAIA